MSTPKRRSARVADQRNSDIAKAEERGNTEFGSEHAGSEGEDGGKSEEPKEPERTYDIKVYVFDKTRKEFESGQVQTHTAKQVETIFAFCKAAWDMRPLKHKMVKVVITTNIGGTTEHEIADSEDFSDYFKNARDAPEANEGKELFGVMLEAGETSDFTKLVENGDFTFA